VTPANESLRQASSPPAFNELFEAELDQVVKTLRRLGVAERDLEDLAHDVFVTVFRKLDEYDPERPLGAWIFGIVFRHAVGYRRLARHKHEVMVPPPEAPASATPDELARIEARQLVIEGLDVLPLDRRAVLVLHDLDGHAIPEVAALLDIPINTAYSRLRVARLEFRAEVERLERSKPSRSSP